MTTKRTKEELADARLEKVQAQVEKERAKLEKLKLEIKEATDRKKEEKTKLKLAKDGVLEEEKKAAKKVKPTTELSFEEKDLPWSVNIKAVGVSDLSGTRSEDIEKLTTRPDSDTALLLTKISEVKIEKLIREGDDESLEEARNIVEVMQKNRTMYAAPLNVLYYDYQDIDEDGNPYPIIPQHFLVGAFRDTLQGEFPSEFGVYTQIHNHRGWCSKRNIKHCISINPKHISIYRDPEMTQRIKASEVEIEGQQPVVPDVKGFGRYEIIHPPWYFQFEMTFFPKSYLPTLSNRELVFLAIETMVKRGIGSRRPMGKGKWKILDVENSEKKFGGLYKKYLEKTQK